MVYQSGQLKMKERTLIFAFYQGEQNTKQDPDGEDTDWESWSGRFKAKERQKNENMKTFPWANR